MSIFKGKKRGQYTAYVNLEGDKKMFNGEPLVNTIVIGKDDVTGEEITRDEFEYQEYSSISIQRNYPKDEKPEKKEDRENYYFNVNHYKKDDKDHDWYCRDKEKKETIGKLWYNEEKSEFRGNVNGKEIYIPVDNERQRTFQVFEGVQNEEAVGNDMSGTTVTTTPTTDFEDEMPF
jgi:hypothetical protein